MLPRFDFDLVTALFGAEILMESDVTDNINFFTVDLIVKQNTI